MPGILAIESTCDETAAAVVVDGWDVRSNVVASQAELHAKYRGVVPEIASRAHIENVLPVVREALGGCEGEARRHEGTEARSRATERRSEGATRGGTTTTQRPLNPQSEIRNPQCSTLNPEPRTLNPPLDSIAVAHRPGLIGSLLIGVTAAKALAWAWGRPLIGVDHVHAHLYSVMLEKNDPPPMPAVGLVVSGGHTALYRVNSWLDVTLIGSTIDDAVGEAYDKVAAILGLGYPGGPILDRLAALGDPQAIRFPRTTLGRESLDFSFSGLKTAVLYHVRGVPKRDGTSVKDATHPPPTGQALHDIAASFQAACVDVIVKKLQRAAKQIAAKSVIIGGGVSANAGLRAAMQKFPLPVYVPPLRYCTDNAAMSAGLANVYYEEGRYSDLGLDAVTFSQFRDA